MSDPTCPDCPPDADAHAEFSEALRADELDLFARADLAADAIDLAEAEARVRRPRLRLVRPALAAAAVVLAAVGLWLLTDTKAEAPTVEPEVVQVPAGGVTKERKANLAFLNDPRTQARLAKVKPGRWVGLQHGKTMLVADELGALDLRLKQAEMPAHLKDLAQHRGPVALHRFTFRKGSEGPKAYQTTFGTPPFVGVRFMANFEFGLGSMRGESIRYVTDHPERGRLELQVPQREGKGAELTLHVGEPTWMASVPLLVGYSTGSAAPLVLPAGMGYPRFEIPGTATLEGGSGHPGTFRRYIASISIPELGIREVFVEAIGNRASPEQANGSLRLGGRTWAPFSSKLIEEARRLKKPILQLVRPRSSQGYPGDPFAGLPVERVAAALEPFVLGWREPGKAATWVGGGDEVPPMEATLRVIQPDEKLRTTRTLVVRPWTHQGHVWTLLAAGRREFKTAGAYDDPITKNETTAIDVLWHIAFAQRRAQEDGLIDTDRNGVGEYGTLWELTGEAKGRMKSRLKPVRLPISFRPAKGQHDLVLEGYRFRLFFPAKGGGAITRPGPNGLNVHVANAEKTWWAYGWPTEQGKTGRRTFYVDQDNVIYGTSSRAGVYEGAAGAPAFDAAFAQRGRVPGGVSPALVSSDGNRWSAVRKVERR